MRLLFRTSRLKNRSWKVDFQDDAYQERPGGGYQKPLSWLDGTDTSAKTAVPAEYQILEAG